MHEKLTNPPLRYVLAQVNISPIGNMKEFVPKLQEAIRQDFPFFNSLKTRTLNMTPTGKSLSLKMESADQWRFRNKTKTTGILLSNNSITLHTSQYEGFDYFINELAKILEKFNKILNISLSLRLGLRYVNVIQSVDKSVNPKLLGFYIDEQPEFEKEKFLARAETIRSNNIGKLRIQSIHVGNKELYLHKGNYFVPPDLFPTTQDISFAHYDEPKSPWLILDLDHYNDTQIDFSIEKIAKNFSMLHANIYNAFKAAVSEAALENWK